MTIQAPLSDVRNDNQSRRRRSTWTGVAIAMVIAAVSALSLGAGQVPGQRYFELEAGSEYSSAQALCEAVAKARRADTSVTNPYGRVVGAKDAGDSVWCELADSEGNKTDQHYGSLRFKCPANGEFAADDKCSCNEGYAARGNQCMVAAVGSKPAASSTTGAASATAPGSSVPPPAKRGLTEIDDVVFQGIALNKRLFILVRDSNMFAPNFNGLPGYLPKPEVLKAKTRKAPLGPDGKPLAGARNVGLAAADPDDPALIKMLEASKPSLTYGAYVITLLGQAPSFVVGPAPDYLIYSVIRNPATRKSMNHYYYSDYDLHGVYDEPTRRPAFNNVFNDPGPTTFKTLLNARFKHSMVQHGPHDDWPKNMSKEAGPNRGPQPPVTAYLPDGSMNYLETITDMKAFYTRHRLPWPYGPEF